MTILSESQLDFLNANRSAAMITADSDGTPQAVRVGVALVGDELWSSGTRDRVRTARLRNDPRCTLFVFESGYGYLTLETTVEILDGPEAPEQSLRLFRVMQERPIGPLSWFGGELDEAAFRDQMSEEGRVIYQFRVTRAYGMT